MPFNFINLKHYSIDYEVLYRELNKEKILNDSNVQSAYLRQWINVLINCDNAIRSELDTKSKITEISQKLKAEPEIFQVPMYHKSNTIYIHFRASIANEIVKESKAFSQHIDSEEFDLSTGRIKWSPVEMNLLYEKRDDPIIIVPFKNNQYNFLVIDGNHRLTYKMQNKKNDIQAIIISEKSVIDYSIFSSGFDKYYYTMANEINHMANATFYNNADAMEVVQKSYLVDRKFKFIDF